MRSHVQDTVRVLSVVDELLIAALLALTWDLHFPRPIPDFLIPILLLPIWSFLFWYFGLYESHRMEKFAGLAGRIFAAEAAGLAIGSGLILAAGLSQQYTNFVRFCLLSTVSVLATRWFLYSALSILRRRGVDTRQVCVLGAWERATDMARRFAENPAWGLRVAMVGTGRAGAREFFRYPSGELRIAAGLDEILRQEVVDEVLLAVSPEALPAEERTIQECQQYGVLCRVLLQRGDFQAQPGGLEALGDHLAVSVGGGTPHSAAALGLKRGIDIILSSILLTLISPLLALVAILVKLSSSGRVFFRQKRVGFHGRQFMMVKFRTMVDGAESMIQSMEHRNITKGPVFKDPQDWRVTPVGRVLRRFSLDELPQLWNVLRGDMSLVGPRPLPVHESAAIAGSHRRRFSMRPGITCLWQVQGRSTVEYGKWMTLDLEYVDNWSIWLDTKLLLRTIPAVLSGRGAY